MGPPTGYPAAPAERTAAADYRRLLAALTSRARRLGSRDPESAAQEALKRSLENIHSQPAVEYYFGQDPPAGLQPPEWPLDRLLAWLHVVLHYVVREEQSRAGFLREMPADGTETERAADPSPDQLHALLRKEIESIVAECFPKLDREYRTVLKMRVNGLKYGEIANRLGISENTVATWVSRGIRDLGRYVRRRTERFADRHRGGR